MALPNDLLTDDTASTALPAFAVRLPAGWSPLAGPLGRFWTRRLGDTRRAGGALVLTALALGVAVVLAGQVAATLLPLSYGVWVWGGQALGLAAVAAAVLTGRTAPVWLRADADTLTFQQGHVRHDVPLSAVDAVHTATPLEVHRHYSRFRRAHTFGRPGSDALVVHAAGDAYVLHLAAEEAAALRAHLATADALAA